MKSYNNKEIKDYILKNYLRIPTKEIAEKVGCSISYVRTLFIRNGGKVVKGVNLSNIDKDYKKFLEKMKLLDYDRKYLKKLEDYEIEFIADELKFSIEKTKRYVDRFLKGVN